MRNLQRGRSFDSLESCWGRQSRFPSLTPREAFLSQVFAYDPAGEFCVIGADQETLVVISPDGTVYSEIDIGHLNSSVGRDSSLTMSDDGRWLIAACKSDDETGRVLLWQVERDDGTVALKSIDSMLTHDAPVTGVDVHEPTRRLASIDSRGMLKTWDLSSLSLVAEQTTPHVVRCRAWFTPNGKHIITHGWDDGSAYLFAADTLEEPRRLYYGNRILCIDIADDGEKLAISGYSGPQLWEIPAGSETPRRIRSLDWRRSAPCRFSPDGTHLAVVSTDKLSVSLFNCETGQFVAGYFAEDMGGRSQLTFQGEHLLCRGDLYLHRFILSEEIVRPLETSGWWYAPMAVAPGGNWVAFTTKSHDIHLWNLSTNKSRILEAAGNSKMSIRALALSHGATRLAVARGELTTVSDPSGEIEIWDLDEDSVLQCLDAKLILSLSFSPIDSDLLVSSGYKGTQLWDLQSGQAEWLALRTRISAEFSPQGKSLFIGANVVNWGDSDKSHLDAETWSLDSRSARRERPIPTQSTYSSSFTSGGRYLSCVNLNKDSVFVWDVENSRKLIDDIDLSSPRVMSLDFSNDDTCMVVSSPAGGITFVDYLNRREIGTFRVPHPLRHIKFLDGCDQIVVSTMDGRILHWGF